MSHWDKITFLLPYSKIRELKEMSLKSGRSVGWHIRDAIYKYLDITKPEAVIRFPKEYREAFKLLDLLIKVTGKEKVNKVYLSYEDHMMMSFGEFSKAKYAVQFLCVLLREIRKWEAFWEICYSQVTVPGTDKTRTVKEGFNLIFPNGNGDGGVNADSFIKSKIKIYSYFVKKKTGQVMPPDTIEEYAREAGETIYLDDDERDVPEISHRELEEKYDEEIEILKDEKEEEDSPKILLAGRPVPIAKLFEEKGEDD